jgi:hypothetical protein
MECPNHEGAFDCTPFCNLCEGEQEYFSLPSYSMMGKIPNKLLSNEQKERLRARPIW